MKIGYHKVQHLITLELGSSLEEFACQPLQMCDREKAKLLLTLALEE